MHCWFSYYISGAYYRHLVGADEMRIMELVVRQ